MKLLIEWEVDESYEHFDVSSGWFYRFKSWLQIGRLVRHGHSAEVDQSELPSDHATIAQQLSQFSSQDIYNADESGLVFNKQPNSSNALKGGKDEKTHITTFHIVNQTGTDKRKLWVIGRARTPKAFRQNRINIANLPVFYRFNKWAWMLSGLWYEFLRSLNDEMHIQHRHIALISDNCPSHPLLDKPPIDYTGPTPLILTNLTLIFLPPCKTAYLQPLDMGIIKAFKAAYQCQYAEYMVERFNDFGETLEKINILKAISLIATAWDITASVPLASCLREADFITEQRAACLGAFKVLQELGESDYQNFDEYFEDFFTETNHTESAIGELATESSLLIQLPDSATIIDQEIRNGLLKRPTVELNGSFLSLETIDNSEDDTSKHQTSTPPPSPVVSTATTIQHITELHRFYQSLPVTHLPNPDPKIAGLVVSKLVSQAEKNKEVPYQVRFPQSFNYSVTNLIFRCSQPQEVSLDLRPEKEEGILGCEDITGWEDDSENSDEEEHFTCVPTWWTTGGINHAFQQL
ncbi:DDE-domain-containing protein [Choiromyces venosus 120613-1]|uniref:DDE-domain-containing protein n=1 Tax=Choiromyces venosus 120613-1 TaxID=1336337 RepID=A0A3N4JKR2_9PEZI|nr:DDE-domain-containing protein [Choiromyces venosus 120613-1]